MSTSKLPLPEDLVLHPRDVSVTNSDEWPEFRLTNATVTSPNDDDSNNNSKIAPISLLLASEINPLRIVGQLEKPATKDQTRLWLQSQSRAVSIEVGQVLSYSYGAYEDGSVELWAAGKAGWFVIRPSKRYRAIYDEMIEAVKILFFIVDAYSTPRKSGKGKNASILPEFTAQELFEKYAVEVLGVEKGAPEAAKRMYRHRDFLLSSMIEGNEGVSWGKNPLYAHFCRKFAEDAKRIRQRKVAANARAKEREEKAKMKTAPIAQRTRQASLDSVSTTSSSLKRKRGRPPKETASIDSSSVAASSNVEVKHPSSHVPTTSKETQQGRSTRSTRSNTVLSTPEIQDSQFLTPAKEQESDSEVPRDRRKSALRLKPNKPIKGPVRMREVPLATDEEDEGNEDDDDGFDSLPDSKPDVSERKRGKPPPARTTKATTVTELARAKGANNTRRSRRSNNKRHTKDQNTEAETVDEGIDIPPSPSTSASASSPDALADLDLSTLPFRLLHQPDQLQQNVWTCALDGCTHKVYGTSSGLEDLETQRLIREHYALHAYDDDERVRLVKGMVQPSLPVNYLVERVRGQVRLEGLGAGSGVGLGGAISRFPTAVVGKY